MKPHERNPQPKITIHRRNTASLLLAMTSLLSWFSLPVLAGLSSTAIATTQMTPPAANVWTSHGPEGAEIDSLAIDPSNSNILYAGASGSIFKSTDSRLILEPIQ